MLFPTLAIVTVILDLIRSIGSHLHEMKRQPSYVHPNDLKYLQSSAWNVHYGITEISRLF